MNQLFATCFLLSGGLLAVFGQVPIANIPYGDDPEQVFDFYMPAQTPVGNNTRVIILVHGGAWSGGQKSDMNAYVPFLMADLPGYYIVNMEYRLGTLEDPGFPKQLLDIFQLKTYIQATFAQKVTFAMMGGSAGAHLSMLYQYSMDANRDSEVKAVVNIVGPTDLTDPMYTGNHDYDSLFLGLVGNCLYTECPELYLQTSPITYANKDNLAPTIGFYGNTDSLIPNTQMPILRDRLQELGVTHDFTVYNGGHADWPYDDQLDMMSKISSFLKMHWVD